MTQTQYLFKMLGVTQTQDIRDNSEIYADILNTNGWDISDCFYWTEGDSLFIINIKEKAKNEYQFVETDNGIEYSCLSSAMIFA